MTGEERPPADVWAQKFRDDLAADTTFEARLLFKEIAIVTMIGGLVLLWIVVS